MNTMRSMLRTITMAALTLGLLSGCAAGGTEMPTDAAGLTQDDVAEMSLHQEYDAYRDHYEHMQRLLKDAQLQVHDGEWEWDSGDDIPQIGGDGVAPLPGSDTKNSYDMRSGRLWSPPGATGEQRDLQPMIDYFTEQGWDIEQRDGHRRPRGLGHHRRRLADHLLGTENGRYTLEVYSELFWTQRRNALSRLPSTDARPSSSLIGPSPASTQTSHSGTTPSSTSRRSEPMLRTITTAALALGLLAGCAAGGDQMPTDAAGLTQDDVAEMSLHQEFDAYRDHYEHMQRLLKAAQLQVHDGEWEWGGGDRVPLIGGDGVAALRGSDSKNSYDMSTTRLWSLPAPSTRNATCSR